MITVHTIVCNEDRFVKSSLTSALMSYDVTRALVWDTGSIDRTVHEIKSMNDARIEFRELGKINRKKLVRYRNEQLQRTKTPWFFLVDGDEIWPEKNLRLLISTMKQCNNETIALVCRTRNVVGDLCHYLPDSEGYYQIGPWKGHLNIRAIRNVPGLTVKGEYPNEWYELGGKKIQDQPERLHFVDTWYLHSTHLQRSNSFLAEFLTIDRLKKREWFSIQRSKVGVMKPDELPETLRVRPARNASRSEADGDLR